ncbi:MAG: hypothetical protein U0Q16_21290 [Bryobacteraceae bacterium]
MNTRYSAGNVTTAVLFALALWTIIVRFRSRPDTNWPLMYYAIVFSYMEAFPGRVAPLALYGAIVTALLERFEFMSGFFRYFLMTLELGALSVITYQIMKAVSLY